MRYKVPKLQLIEYKWEIRICGHSKTFRTKVPKLYGNSKSNEINYNIWLQPNKGACFLNEISLSLCLFITKQLKYCLTYLAATIKKSYL